MEAAIQTVGTLPGAILPARPQAAPGTATAGAQRRDLASDRNAQTEWVRRAQEGDLKAFEHLFGQYQRGIYNLIFQMVRNESDAADLTQDVFVRAWKSLPRLQAPEAFTSWLYRVATNLTRNWIRDHGKVRHESLDQPFAGDEEEGGGREIADFSGDPAGVTETRAMQEKVRGAIDGLSPDHRQVVTLHHIEGMAVEEIAQIMNCSVGTVKSRLSRARDHLRRKLAGYVEG
jgi:RNA polymerase sigma-70 factor, ECF subfamily